MAAAARRTVVGNWKCHGVRASLEEVRALAAALSREPAGVRVGVCPPDTLLHAAVEAAAGGPVEIGAQNVAARGCGAHTGDVAAPMLVDAGVRWVICGHSERRAAHGETDADIAAKARAALAAGLEPIVCVGESPQQHARGEASAVVRRQLEGSLPEELKGARFCVAYEPNWAIGTGKTPTPEQISGMHAMIADWVRPFGEAVALLYGGSVTGENATELLGAEHVDGALVGGASLTCAKFLPIVRALAALARGEGG